MREEGVRCDEVKAKLRPQEYRMTVLEYAHALSSKRLDQLATYLPMSSLENGQEIRRLRVDVDISLSTKIEPSASELVDSPRVMH